MRNHATWVVVGTIIAYMVLDFALTTPINRGLMAAIAIIFAFTNTGRYLPPALRAFRRGGMQDNWQLLMGNVLFWSGFGCREIYVWIVRVETTILHNVRIGNTLYESLIHRPEYLINNPLEGFFVLWIAGGGYLCWYAGRRGPPEMIQPHKAYYLLLGGVIGLALGVLGYRLYLQMPF